MFSLKRNQVIVTALVVMIAVAGYLNIVDGKKAQSSPETAMYQELPDGTLVPNEDLLEVSSPNVEGEIGIAVSTEDDDMYGSEVAKNLDPAEGGFTKNLDLLEDEYAKDLEPTKSTEPKKDKEELKNSANASTAGQAIFVNSSTAPAESEYFVTAKLEREQTRSKEKEILTDMIGNQNLNKEDISQCAAALLDIQKRIEKEAAAEAMIEAKGFKEAYVRIDDNTIDVIVSKSALSEAEIAQIEDIVTRKTGFTPDKIRISALKASS